MGHRCPLSPKFQFYFNKGSSKNFLWASRLWVGRRKEPILGYVPKKDEKKNLVHKGLNKFTYMYWGVNSFHHFDIIYFMIVIKLNGCAASWLQTILFLCFILNIFFYFVVPTLSVEQIVSSFLWNLRRLRLPLSCELTVLRSGCVQSGLTTVITEIANSGHNQHFRLFLCDKLWWLRLSWDKKNSSALQSSGKSFKVSSNS